MFSTYIMRICRVTRCHIVTLWLWHSCECWLFLVNVWDAEWMRKVTLFSVIYVLGIWLASSCRSCDGIEDPVQRRSIPFLRTSDSCLCGSRKTEVWRLIPVVESGRTSDHANILHHSPPRDHGGNEKLRLTWQTKMGVCVFVCVGCFHGVTMKCRMVSTGWTSGMVTSSRPKTQPMMATRWPVR